MVSDMSYELNYLLYCVQIKKMIVVIEYDHGIQFLHLGPTFLHCVFEKPFCTIC